MSFIMYYVVSGLAMAALAIIKIDMLQTDDALEDLRNLAWETGYKPENVKFCAYLLCLLFGFVLLPISLLQAAVHIITGGKHD